MWASYIFHFFTNNYNLHTWKILIFFCIIYVAMSNIHFSGFDNAKWLPKHISIKVSFKITIRKRHIYMTFVDIENENSNSIWEFEKMNVLKQYFCIFSARYTFKFTEEKWKKFINEIWHINLYMNISNSNWHNLSFDSTIMNYYFISVPYTITDLQPL